MIETTITVEHGLNRAERRSRAKRYRAEFVGTSRAHSSPFTKSPLGTRRTSRRRANAVAKTARKANR